MGGITDMFGGGGGDDAADAAIEGSEIQAQSQREALDYLKQTEQLPQAYREQSLAQLGSLYGLPGMGSVPYGGYAGQDQQSQGGDAYTPMGMQEFIDSLRQNPFYTSMLDQGEQAVMRNASATGGMRSGGVQEGLAQNSQNVLQGLYNQQVQGLQGLAGMQSYAPEIASQMTGIGQTLGQGYIAASQAGQAGQQQGIGNLMGVANLGLQAYGSGMFSDRRLKENIKLVGKYGDHNLYTWTWKDEAKKLGLEGDGLGVIADEVERINPSAVTIVDGYQNVDYSSLGVN